MQRRLAQLIALVLAVTGILNARCFVSCAVGSLAAPDHACCPHQKAPAVPCSHKTAQVKAVSVVSVSPVAAILPEIPALWAPQVYASATHVPLSTAVARELRTSILVLRI